MRKPADAREAPRDWDIPREAAIPRLLDLCGGRLYGLARRLCGTEEEALDLVQETMLLAFRKWHQFDGRSDPFPWLYTIAARVCQRLHRKKAGEPKSLESLDELLPFGRATMGVASPAGDEDVLAGEVRREAIDRVGTAIASLPLSFRLPLVLKDIVEFSVAEVAAILGLAEATVKTRLHRARLKVRAALERVLPQRELPPRAYSKQVCLDLLRAKQESLDRGAEMPGAERIICERCRALFGTMDLARELCQELGEQELPSELSRILQQEIGG